MKNIIYIISIFFIYFLSIGIKQCEAQTNFPSLTSLGNAFVKIKTSEGKIIYIDPYAVNQSDSADIVLITHEHYCHNDLARIIQKSTCQVIRTANALIDSVYQNFTIGNITIQAVPAYNQFHPKYEGVGYVIDFDSMRIYHAGGTANIPEMADLTSQDITYALYPMTPGPEDLTQAAAVVQAKHDIPMHTVVSADLAYKAELVVRFRSPHKLVVLPRETIELKNDTTSHIGEVLRVPQEYPTIQAAIDAAQNSDTVLVSEGKYYENIRYKGKGIVVTSRYFITKDWQTVVNTVIDGSTCLNKDTASTVQFLNREDSTSVLDGFTITGGTGTRYLFPNGIGTNKWQEGAGIVMDFSSAIIRNNIIMNNAVVPQPGVTYGGGGAIASMYGNPIIYDNVIFSNTGNYAGGIVLNWSGGIIKNNIIYHNSAGSPYGCGGTMAWYSPKYSAYIENNTIVGNSSLSTAGGIDITIVDATSIPVVRNNIVWGNKQVSGGQIKNSQYSNYNIIEDYPYGTNISAYPAIQEGYFLLSTLSPCIDAGDPDTTCSDIEDPLNPGMALSPSNATIRNDIGAYGGRWAKSLSPLNTYYIDIPKNASIIQCPVGQHINTGFAMRNLSSWKIIVDSVTQSNATMFNIDDYSGKVFDLFFLDSLKVTFAPSDTGIFYDTLKLYHNATGIANPLVFSVQGKAVVTPTEVKGENLMSYNYELLQNYPNPFNPVTVINYKLSSPSYVSLKVFDILGREIAILVNEVKTAGNYYVTWNASTLPSGIYFYRILAGNFSQTRKMLMTK